MPCSKLLILKNFVDDAVNEHRDHPQYCDSNPCFVFSQRPANVVTTDGARARATPVLPTSFRSACRSLAAPARAVQPDHDLLIAEPSVQADRTAGFFGAAPEISPGQRQGPLQN